MNASAKIFRFAMAVFFFAAVFVHQSSASHPDKKKGATYKLTSHHLSPKQFEKAYQAERKENARLMERSHRKMAHKQHGWGFFRYRAENHHEANHTRLN
jgi:hypothetical protein